MALDLLVEYDLKTASFYKDGVVRFIGETKSRLWKTSWTLIDPSSNVIASYILKQKPFVPSCELFINFKNENATNLVLLYKRWRPHITFTHKSDHFLIVIHTGTKISFFRNEKQFALLEKTEVAQGGVRKYRIVADETTSIELLIPVCYGLLALIENTVDQNHGLTINLGTELQAIDHLWRPAG